MLYRYFVQAKTHPWNPCFLKDAVSSSGLISDFESERLSFAFAAGIYDFSIQCKFPARAEARTSSRGRVCENRQSSEDDAKDIRRTGRKKSFQEGQARLGQRKHSLLSSGKTHQQSKLHISTDLCDGKLSDPSVKHSCLFLHVQENLLCKLFVWESSSHAQHFLPLHPLSLIASKYKKRIIVVADSESFGSALKGGSTSCRFLGLGRTVMMHLHLFSCSLIAKDTSSMLAKGFNDFVWSTKWRWIAWAVASWPGWMAMLQEVFQVRETFS